MFRSNLEAWSLYGVLAVLLLCTSSATTSMLTLGRIIHECVLIMIRPKFESSSSWNKNLQFPEQLATCSHNFNYTYSSVGPLWLIPTQKAGEQVDDLYVHQVHGHAPQDCFWYYASHTDQMLKCWVNFKLQFLGEATWSFRQPDIRRFAEGRFPHM